ncbi:hypothetical protein LTR28_004009 [Elasticomyces elasticus]|nr:hypothetical protein LTR28_004009 [Elasticomyces elasticus]
MAFLLPRLTPLTFAAGTTVTLGLSAPFIFSNFQTYTYRHAYRLDGPMLSNPTSPREWSFSQYQNEARAPVVKNGRLNPSAVRQVSIGSIAGLLGGLAVSTFSKPLALLIGLLIFGVQVSHSSFNLHPQDSHFTPAMQRLLTVVRQALESRGISIIPYQGFQRYVKSIDLRSAVQDNVAFKLSFGATFALAAFAEF